mmetsp:Transcript_124682/g.364159  ORF Transcript_124682/g.364159 Transcript_124682/m.364159 type:complete len:875 (-) Transcript_124682:70-2694(-)
MAPVTDEAQSGDGQGLPGALVAGVFVTHAPAFSARGLRLFAPCGRTALCFSVRTSRQIGALPPHEGRVTAVCAGPLRADKLEPLATGSALGEVRLWDSKSYTCLGTISYAEPVLALRWPKPNTLLALLGQSGQPAHLERIQVDDLSAPGSGGRIPVSAVSAGPFDAVDDVLALADGKDLCVWGENWQASQRYSHQWTPTAMVIDSQKQFLVTGDERGIVWTWWNILDGEHTKRVPARWHWHHTPVRALAQCGPVILSGGDEGVLCIRGAHDSADAVRFVPRFPGPLRHFATVPDSGRVGVSIGGNTLALIDELQGFVQPRWIHGIDAPLAPAGAEAGLNRTRLLHPLADGGVAMTSSGRRAQFLSAEGVLQPQTLLVNRGDCVHSMDGGPEYKWTLWHVAFSASAAHVMTCESRRTPALERFHGERAQSSVLKWWSRGETGEYLLHSVAHGAHSAEVTVALAHPRRERRFVTASLDGAFRFWDLLPGAGGAGGEAAPEGGPKGAGAGSCWQCVLSGGWHAWPILCGCLGADGSALALGLRGFVTLWGTEDGTELQQLALGEATQEVESLLSVVACGRFLLLAGVRGPGSEELLCWDLADLQVLARLDLASALAGSGRSVLRVSSPASGGSGVHLLACRMPLSELQLWWLSPGPECSLKLIASVPLEHGILDAVFLGSERRVLCWTSAYELLDLDLSQARSVSGPTTGLQAEEEEERVTKTSRLAQVIGAKATAEGTRLTSKDKVWQLCASPLRATAAQQAGMVPQFLERVLPPHIPSHMLHPPSMIWASMLSTFGKSAPASLPAGGGERHRGAAHSAGLLESSGIPRPGGEAAPSEGGLPPWVSSGQPAVAPQAEVVDVAWMDSFVQSTLQGGE